ncbi:MAG: DUF3253 domain-containing protein, partial [Myxococcota bacterium]
KKWAASWEDVKYCSASCRRDKPNHTDRALEDAILAELEARPGRAGVDPETVVSFVPADRRGNMRERARRAARRLVADGRVEMIQRGRPVDPSTAKGAVHVRRV